MKKEFYFRFWLLILINLIATTSKAEYSIIIEGYKSVALEDGSPFFRVESNQINIKLFDGNRQTGFDTIKIDGILIDENPKAFWYSYVLDISTYCDTLIHTIKLTTYASSVTFYFTVMQNEFNGVYYYTYDDYASVQGANSNIEIADILNYYEKDGKSYPVTKIENNAFLGCENLKTVRFPDTLTYIGASAFRNCTNLSTVVLPNSVENVLGNAFFNCSSLIKNAYPDILSNPFTNGISIAYPAEDVTFENGEIYNADKTKLFFVPIDYSGEFNMPKSVKSIGNNAFSNCINMNCVRIPENVAEIGESAFSQCFDLDRVIIDDIEPWCNIIFENQTANPTYYSHGLTLNGSEITNLTVPNTITSIGNYAFYNCESFASVTIPSSVNKIGNETFKGCNGLKSLTIGEGLLSIGNSAFSESSSNTPLTIPKVFWMCSNSPVGSNNIKALVNYVPNERYKLNNMLIYPYITSKFDVDGVSYIPVSPSERTCDVVDCIYDETIDDFIITEKVSYRNIEMSILSVNQYSFYDNSYIKTLFLSNNGDLGSYAFSDCVNLKSLSILNKGNIKDRTFNNCSSIESLKITDKTSSIGNYAFAGCVAIKNVRIEEDKSALSIGSNGNNPLFSDCPLKEVYIGRKLSYQTSSSYGYSPFYRNTSLQTVEISDAETQIYDNEFYGCLNLKSCKIGSGVKAIGKNAFSNCANLAYFSIGYEIEKIGDNAFSGCSGLTEFYSYATIPPLCGNGALNDINKWDCTLYVPDESSDEYQAAPQWKDFFFIEEMDAVLVAELRLNLEEVVLGVEETVELSVEILPTNAANKAVEWSSSDESVATVSDSGLVTALSAGSATITVRSKDGNSEATCSITVQEVSGVDGIYTDNEIVEVYNLNGYKVSDFVDNLVPGIYIVRQGAKTYKISIK